MKSIFRKSLNDYKNLISLRKGHYLSSVNPCNKERLLGLQLKMQRYYHNPQYQKWIQDANINWKVCLDEVCYLLKPGSLVIEAGCGSGAAGDIILRRVKNSRYIGIDLNINSKQYPQSNFLVASLDKLPLMSCSVDAVFSLFVIEHLVFPALFLEEAWRVLRKGGILIIVSPDFSHTPMPSEPIGLTYGSGREKLMKGKIVDALLTTYDGRIRIPWIRWQRSYELGQGQTAFPILIEPRCLLLPNFVPDCDAVYPSSPDELTNFMHQKTDCKESQIFYRDQFNFGLVVEKK